MKITEKKLRSIIRNVIRESSMSLENESLASLYAENKPPYGFVQQYNDPYTELWDPATQSYLNPEVDPSRYSELEMFYDEMSMNK